MTKRKDSCRSGYQGKADWIAEEEPKLSKIKKDNEALSGWDNIKLDDLEWN